MNNTKQNTKHITQSLDKLAYYSLSLDKTSYGKNFCLMQIRGRPPRNGVIDLLSVCVGALAVTVAVS